MVSGDRGDPQKNFEKIVALAKGEQGERGVQGNQGNQGERGQLSTLSQVQGRAVVVLFLIGVMVGMANLFWTAHEVNATAAWQHRQDQAVAQKLCTTFGKLAVLQPPPGNPATNPSRAYDQELHSTLDELGTDLGCG
jgi:hypothetical protein